MVRQRDVVPQWRVQGFLHCLTGPGLGYVRVIVYMVISRHGWAQVGIPPGRLVDRCWCLLVRLGPNTRTADGENNIKITAPTCFAWGQLDLFPWSHRPASAFSNVSTTRIQCK